MCPLGDWLLLSVRLVHILMVKTQTSSILVKTTVYSVGSHVLSGEKWIHGSKRVLFSTPPNDLSSCADIHTCGLERGCACSAKLNGFDLKVQVDTRQNKNAPQHSITQAQMQTQTGHSPLHYVTEVLHKKLPWFSDSLGHENKFSRAGEALLESSVAPLHKPTC